MLSILVVILGQQTLSNLSILKELLLLQLYFKFFLSSMSLITANS